jgi:hypothetical protein
MITLDTYSHVHPDMHRTVQQGLLPCESETVTAEKARLLNQAFFSSGGRI